MQQEAGWTVAVREHAVAESQTLWVPHCERARQQARAIARTRQRNWMPGPGCHSVGDASTLPCSTQAKVIGRSWKVAVRVSLASPMRWQQLATSPSP